VSAKSNLPEGFNELTRRVLRESSFAKNTLPRKSSLVWDDFTYFAFLDFNRTDAQANYLYELFEKGDLLDQSTILRLGTRWAQKARSHASVRLARLGIGRKRQTLSEMSGGQLDEANRTLVEAAHFFRDNSVTPEFLRRNTTDLNLTNDLIMRVCYPDREKNPRHIHRFGLTKFILFLNDYGLALNYCPPSRQVLSFVERELMHRIRPSLLSEDQELVENWADLFIAIGKMRSLAQTLTTTLSVGVTTADVGHTIWLYKSTQNLLAFSRLRPRLTPRKFLAFVDASGWELSDLTSRLTDIDEVDGLAEELRDFLVQH